MALPMILSLRPLYKATTDGAIEEWSMRVLGPTPEGYAVLETTYGHVGGKKQKTEDVIKAGKNAGKKNATSIVEQACAEAQARWKKKADRKGYGIDPSGVESAAKRALAPMLASDYSKRSKFVDWDAAWAQPKLDGFRCLVRVDADGKAVAYSREGKLLQVPHIQAAVMAVKGAAGVTLDGELYAHGMPLSKIASLCKKLQPETEEHIRLHLYDAVMPVPYSTRLAFIKDFGDCCDSDIIDVVRTVKVRSASDLDVVEKECIDQGYEGAMLRFGREGYQAGQRSPYLLKVKRFLDDEFEITEYKFGRGRYEGIPIFVCKTPAGHEFEVTAHGTLEEKRALGLDPEAHIGRLLKVKFAGYTATEKPKPFQPVSLGFSEREEELRGRNQNKHVSGGSRRLPRTASSGKIRP